MREILFRGKRMNNGEWVYGSYAYQYGCHEILLEECEGEYGFDHYHVDHETVGQFTGLTDKNGKKIFEGDILPIEDEIVAVVIFKEGCFRLEEYGLCGTWTESGFDECGGGWGVVECEPIDWYTICDMEIIGNIHDNAELLRRDGNA